MRRLSEVRSQKSKDRSQKTEVRRQKSVFCILCSVFCILFSAFAYADDNPLNLMRDNVFSYFKPLKGKIISVSDGKAIADIGVKSEVKKGMRFTVFREGAPFLHPVTKEPIGKLETVVGKVEVKDVGPDTSTMVILSGDVRGDDKIRISETGVKALFYQGRNVDWSLADSYYRVLKDTGRLELIDTSLESDNDAEIIAEAKRVNADVVLILSAKEAGGDTMLKQGLFWVDNPPIPPLTKGGEGGFAEDEVKITGTFMKELKFGEEFFGPQKGESRLYVDLPFGVRLIASGDIDGDGKAELLMSTGKDVRLYVPGGELSGTEGTRIKGSVADDHIYLDAMDINGDGKDEVIITFMKDNAVISRIYGLKDSKFSVLWEGNVFLRRIGNELAAQAYAHGEGYNGSVFTIVWHDGYKKGSNVSLPKDVNIYDFVYINESGGGRLILAYDDAGYLNLYDDKGGRIWRSKEDYGGFLTTFKRISPSGLVDRGEWSVKDRFLLQNREIFIIKRIPFVGIAKGIGYSKSQIKSLWWTGASMEERNVIEDIPGKALDYTLAGDKLIVLSSPSFGIKLGNILKGENPLGSALYIYSLMQ